MRLGAALLAICLPAIAQAQLTVTKPWMRYLLPNIPAAAYMVLQNNGDTSVEVTGAASPDCGSLMLHESQDVSGMAMMMAVPSLAIPAHGAVTLAPGGYHLMCMAPRMQVGSLVPITLTLRSGAPIAVTAKVYGATAAP